MIGGILAFLLALYASCRLVFCIPYLVFCAKGSRGRIQRKTWSIGPMLELTITSPYVDSGVDSNTCTLGIGQPYARIDLNSLPDSILSPRQGLEISSGTWFWSASWLSKVRYICGSNSHFGCQVAVAVLFRVLELWHSYYWALNARKRPCLKNGESLTTLWVGGRRRHSIWMLKTCRNSVANVVRYCQPWSEEERSAINNLDICRGRGSLRRKDSAVHTND